MKKLINYLSIVSMLVLAFGFVINVFAVNPASGGVVTDTGSITITGASVGNTDPADDDTFKAYKLIDLVYNPSSNTISHQFTTTFKNFLDNHTTDYKTPDNGGTFTVAQFEQNQNNVLDSIATEYIQYIKNNTVTDEVVFGQNSDPKNVASGVPAGSYLIVANSTKRVYKVMVGNIELVRGNDGNYAIQNATVEAKGTSIADGIISGPSGDDVVTVTDPDTGEEKAVVELTNGDTGSDGSYGVGDDITYDINVTIPSYPSTVTNPPLTLTADIPPTIDFSGLEDNVKVIVNGQEYPVVNGKVVINGQEVADAMMLDSNNSPTNNPANADKVQLIFDTAKINGDVTVEFTGTLKENPEVGSPSNIVDVTVEYYPDPYKADPETAELGFGITTYGLKIQLVENNGAGSGFITNVNAATLAGAKFKVCSDAACEHVVIPDNKLVTNASGLAEYSGIAGGTYYVTNTTAVSGFRLASQRTINIPTDTANMDENYYELTITAESSGLLPSTGGIGTLLFSIIGILVIGMAFYFIIDYRKKKENVNAN